MAKGKGCAFAGKNFGLIPDDTVEALEERRKEKMKRTGINRKKGNCFMGHIFIPTDVSSI
ncbi:MAG: hypothetical protein ACLRZ6_03305 [Lachnospiraceae bacterium]